MIDEPDAHIHIKTQRKLVDRLQSLRGYQLFIISHNDRFVNETQDEKLFYIKDVDKPSNIVSNIDPIIRPLLIEGLTGIVNELDLWRTAQKIVLVEGDTDESMLIQLLNKYESVSGIQVPRLKFYRLKGIDYMYAKMDVLTRALDGIIPNKKWLLIRDTDCFPISKINNQKDNVKNGICRNVNFEIYCQSGYGIESTYMTDKTILAKILHNHYLTVSIPDIEAAITDVNRKFNTDVHDSTNNIYKELKQHFDRQKIDRHKIYNNITFIDVINEISDANIQYIMTKQIAIWYYEEIHRKLQSIDPTITGTSLTPNDIQSRYFANINSVADIFPCHQALINEIIRL